MPIPLKFKKRWDVYSTLQDVLTATQNLSVSPFGTTIDDDLQDFRGIKLIGKGECINVSLSNSDFSGSLWQNFQIAETETFTPLINRVIFDESSFQQSEYTPLCGRGTTFLSCCFINCKYKGVGFLQTVIKDCLFSDIKKNVRLDFNCKLIEDCLFIGDIYKAKFWYSSLKNCIFEGVLYDTSFWGARDFASQKEPILPEKVDNRMENIDFSQAEMIQCNFWAYCYLDKVKPSERNCVFKVTNEFYECLLTQIQSSESPLKEKLIKWAKLFYAPHITAPYRVAHPNDVSFNRPEDTEFSQTLYNFVCKAAEATGCMVK